MAFALPSLFERDDELTSLVAALADPPGLVLVEGEAGIGKTRLVRDAVSAGEFSGRQVLVGQVRPARPGCPLASVVEALACAGLPPGPRLSPLTGALRAVLPERAEQLPPAPPPLDDLLLARHRLLRAAAGLLHDLGPVILVLEDVQWADDLTIEFIGMVSARHPPDLSVVVTYRGDEVPAGAPLTQVLAGSPGVVRIRLAPLSVTGTASLAAAVLGEPATRVPRTVAERLQERGGGVPLVVTEDVRLLRARRLLHRTLSGWALADGSAGAQSAVPPVVRARVTARADALGPAARRALDAAAVLGEPAPVELLAEVAGLDPGVTLAAVEEAMRAGLLRDAQPGRRAGITFRYSLARHAGYLAIPGPRRRSLHTAAAAALAARDRVGFAGRIAEHHRSAGNLVAWATAAEAAADLAVGRGGLAAAGRQLRDLLRAGTVAECRRARLAIKLGWTARDCPGDAGATVALLTDALNRPAVSTPERGELRLVRAWSQLAAGEPPGEAVAAEIKAAIRELVDRPDLRAVGFATLADPSGLPSLGMPEHLASLSRARAALARTRDPVAHAFVRSAAASVLMAFGSPQAWRSLDALPEPGPLARVNREIIRALAGTAEAALHLGHLPGSRELAERGRRLARDVSLHVYDVDLEVAWLRARWTMGDSGVEEQALRLAREARAPVPLPARLLSGQILAGRGHLDQARDVLRSVAEQACRTGDLVVAAGAAGELSRTAVGAAERRIGYASASRIADALTGKRVWVWAAPLLPFADMGVVRRVLARYREGTSGRDAPSALAALSFAEARIAECDGDPATASARYAAARLRYAALPDPRMAAHAAAGRVGCQLAAGAPVDAELLMHAWRTFARLNAVWDADRVKQLIRRAGLPAPHRRGRPGYGNRLSPREREIAVLAAAGHTNRDIAVRLFLSERTVKYHVANAMRKLNVAGRRQLPDVLATGGGVGGSGAPAADRRGHTCQCVTCDRLLPGN